MPRKIASTAVTVSLTSMLAVSLAGCSSDDGQKLDADYAQVCQDKETGQRVEDDKCEQPSRGHSAGGSGFMWYYLGMMSNSHSTVPAVGSRVVGGTTTIPQGQRAATVPAAGGDYYSTTSAAKGSGKNFSTGKTLSNADSVTRGSYGSKGGGSGS